MENVELKRASTISADEVESYPPENKKIKGSTSATTLDETLPKEEGLLDPMSVDVDDSDSDDSDFSVDLSDLEEEDDQVFPTKATYNVMTEAEALQFLEEDINKTSDILCISRAEATIVLLCSKWDVEAVTEKWFDKAEKLREEFGLKQISAVKMESDNTTKMSCGICSGKFPDILMAAASCGHNFCKTCWQGFFEKSLGDYLIRCPEPSCKIVVTPEVTALLDSEQVKEKYARNFLWSYVESNDEAKQCPLPNCNNVVFIVTHGSPSKVTCNCLHSFCWECTREAHEPIPCDSVKRWETEQQLVKQNRNFEKSRKCPKCQLLIMCSGCYKHMECKRCNFHFCRDCCKGWMEHGRWEGVSFRHQCSPTNSVIRTVDDAQRRSIEEFLQRFHKYDAQWIIYDQEQQLAVRMIRKLQSGELKIIADKQGIAEEEMNFVTEAWHQIADCKRIFKWILVLDYLNPFQNDSKRMKDYLLGRATFVMQHLYQRVADLAMFVELNGLPSPLLEDFRHKISIMISVARNYFENMVWIIQTWPMLHNYPYAMSTLRAKLSWKLSVSPPVKQPTPDAGPSTLKKGGDGSNWTCGDCLFENGDDSTICLMCYH